jgi:hypothetical protein
MESVVNAMARAMFVSAWADKEEEEGRSHGGEELMDVAPETPEDAIHQAWRLCGQFEALNKSTIAAMFVHALRIDVKLCSNWGEEAFERAEERWASDFGHYLAMRALGHGVAWEDDHRDPGFTYPHFEYYL